jgi:hypothetical protein
MYQIEILNFICNFEIKKDYIIQKFMKFKYLLLGLSIVLFISLFFIVRNTETKVVEEHYKKTAKNNVKDRIDRELEAESTDSYSSSTGFLRDTINTDDVEEYLKKVSFEKAGVKLKEKLGENIRVISSERITKTGQKILDSLVVELNRNSAKLLVKERVVKNSTQMVPVRKIIVKPSRNSASLDLRFE